MTTSNAGIFLLAVLAGLVIHYTLVLAGVWMAVARKAARRWRDRKNPQRARVAIDDALRYTLITAAQHSALLAEFEFNK